MQRKILAAAIFALFALLSSPSFAQISPTILPSGCGTGAATGSMGYLTVDSTLKLCVNATVSASITGFPTVQSTGAPIAVTTGGVTGTLPTGAVVVASNVGTTNGAYCKLGASATTSDQLIPPNSWFSFTVGANTQLTCITSTSTTTVNMVGGSGLPTGSGGGGGGGSGGAVTLASAAPVPSAAVESNHVLKNAAGNIVSLTTTIGAVSGFVMLFDATSAPADGAVTPKYCRFILSNGTAGAASLDWIYPMSFATGITAVFSSTGCFTKTASSTAFFEGQVQ